MALLKEAIGGGGKEDWYYYFTVSWIRVSRPPASVPRFIYINHKVKTGQKAGKHSSRWTYFVGGGEKGWGREGGGMGTLLGRLAKEKS